MELSDNDPFFAKYADAVRAMHKLPENDGRNWRRQAKIHADACKHGQLEFLHWHRHYITFFEAICGEMIGDPGFALPYWNWSKKSGIIPAPFYDIEALNVEFWNDPGDYSSPNWGPVRTIAERGLAKGRGLLDDPVRGGSFTNENIASIKRLTRIATFRSRLEGSPHNDGHVVAGALPSGATGHIGDGLSPLDPIFWLHHCMVDRVWAEWQRAGNSSPDPGTIYSGVFFDKSGNAATVTAGSALTTQGLGYTYDILQPVAPTSGQTGLILNDIIPQLTQALNNQGVSRTLGVQSNDEVSEPLAQTAVEVSVPGLIDAIAGDRAFRQLSVGKEASVNIEGQRVLANLEFVTPPKERSDIVVNVFVSCPYLSPSTPYADPHYAGTFSFFGRMGAMPGMSSEQNFLIDITAPVRNLAAEGRIKTEQLTIQLMPLPAHIEGKSDATFQVRKVAILTD